MASETPPPSLWPFPVAFNIKPDVVEFPCTIIITNCSFYSQGFEPAWDCKILSCQHLYHSWCATTHFGSSLKCVHNGCDHEPHPNWWKFRKLKLLPKSEKGCIGEETILHGQQVGMLFILVQCRFLCLQKVLGLLVVCLQI
jgi:hypothetical protein